MSGTGSLRRDEDFEEAVREICRKDARYHPNAYLLVRDAIQFTHRKLKRPTRGPGRHLTGAEVLEGFREYVLREFGPMAYSVLTEWGVHRTEDVGEIVFRLISAGRLGKAPADTPEDFARGYDFREAFEHPFLPPSRRPPRRRLRTPRPPPESGD